MKRAWMLGIVAGMVLAATLGAVAPNWQSDANQSYTFDSGAVAVAGDGAFHAVATIQANGRPVRLQGTVGSVALAGLKITDTAVQAGTESTLAQDSDFATATNPGVAYSRPSTPQTTAASGTFDLLITAGSADYVVYAKSAGSATTLRVTGSVWSKGVN